MGTRSPGACPPGPAGRALTAVAGALLAALLGGLALAPGRADALADPPHEPLARFPTAEIKVDSGGQSHVFKVWIAATPARHEQGLMYVRSLGARQGMLFLFEEAKVETFWMKNTRISLDLLFIAPDGRIIRIAENARPESLETISSMGIVRGVLEVAGGTSARLGIRPGDRVLYPDFRPN